MKTTLVLAVVLGLAMADYYDIPEDVRANMHGTKLDGKSNSREGVDHFNFEIPEEHGDSVLDSLPASFVAGTDKWQQCNPTISFIKNQAACGSCWAVAASETIADRECIHCGAGVNTSMSNHHGPNEHAPGFDISAEQIMACCSSCGNGCQGGYIIDAMAYYKNNGIVTGGWFGSKCGCQSYEVDPASHTEEPTPACASSCDDPNYPDSFNADKHFASEYHGVKGESAMMLEIYNNGPIECGFTVKRSFETFFKANPKGIYTGGGWFDRTLGGHAIKIIGWGEGEVKGKTVKYWVINNSWSTSWANGGKFFFLRGKNLNGMEAQCAAATPKCGNQNPKANSLQCKGIDY